MLDRGLVRQWYIGLVTEYAGMLETSLGDRLYSVCLFGSIGRGDFTAESDVDVIVVADGLPADIGLRYSMFNELRMKLLRTAAASKIREHGYSTSLSEVYLSREEALRHPPILLDVVEDGVIVYDRDGFLEGVLGEIRRRLEELGARRVFTSRGWYWILKPDAKLGEEIII